MSENTVKKSVTMRRSVVEQIEERVGADGLSGFIDAAAEHWLALLRGQEREGLHDLIRDSGAVNGPADPSRVEAKRAILRGETTERPTSDERGERADRGERARAALWTWNGYAPTDAEQRELDGELDRRMHP